MIVKSSPKILAILSVALPVMMVCPGCGGAPSAPMSKIVNPDSDEGRKAQADDEAFRQSRQQQEAKALSRKRGFKPPGKN